MSAFYKTKSTQDENNLASDSDVCKYYEMQVKLGMYLHMSHTMFNGSQQCPTTQLMISFNTCHSPDEKNEIRKKVKQELPELEEHYKIYQSKMAKKLEKQNQFLNDKLNAEITRKRQKDYREPLTSIRGALFGGSYAPTMQEEKAARKKRDDIRRLTEKSKEEREKQEFEKRFQEEEKEKRYQEFKRTKQGSKSTPVAVAVAVPILEIVNNH
jgi:hypothetical protein